MTSEAHLPFEPRSDLSAAAAGNTQTSTPRNFLFTLPTTISSSFPNVSPSIPPSRAFRRRQNNRDFDEIQH
jgi:hypothetical protein